MIKMLTWRKMVATLGPKSLCLTKGERVTEKCLSHVIIVSGSAIDNQVDQGIYPNGSTRNPESTHPLGSQVKAATHQPPLLGPQHETVYFRDGVRKIDFVLAFDSEKNHLTELRKTFENNLLLEGKWVVFEIMVETSYQQKNEVWKFISYDVLFACWT